MTEAGTIPFVKMHGIGNDFVMLDTLREGLPNGDLAELSCLLCDRRRGVGGDGLILLEAGNESPFRMRMFNPDGSLSEMCGNGLRCAAQLARDRGYALDEKAEFETGAGKLTVRFREDGQIQVDMGPASFSPEKIGLRFAGERFVNEELGFQGLRGTAVSMGNPHLVIFVPAVAAVPLEDWGPMLEHDKRFAHRTNVHFIQVVDRGHLIQRTWERGAGITLACGTGACASAAAALAIDLAEPKVQIDLPGGRLEIEVLESGVLMTGPATTVFHGVAGAKPSPKPN